MKEFGGYLELENYAGVPYHKNMIALDCGRSCISYLVELREIHKMAIPDYLCDSVSELLLRIGIEVRVYPIDTNLVPTPELTMKEDEWLLLVDYYGQLTRETVEFWLGKTSGRVIVDETEGFFRNAWEGVDTFWNCRKWFGVPDGAYLNTSEGAKLSRKLPRSESALWMNHILGRAEENASLHLDEFRMNDERLAGTPPALMSIIAERLLAPINYDNVQDVRRRNWDVLEAELGKINKLKLKKPFGPFMYPFLVSNTSNVRARLAQSGVYVPTLWPSVLNNERASTVAKKLSENVMPIPLDQRYSTADMEYVAYTVKKELNI